MLYQINHFLFPNHTIKDDQIASRNKTQAFKEETKIILSKKNLRDKYETNKNDGIMIKPKKLIPREWKGSVLSVRVELIFFTFKYCCCYTLAVFCCYVLWITFFNRRIFHTSFHFSQSFFSFPETVLLFLETSLTEESKEEIWRKKIRFMIPNLLSLIFPNPFFLMLPSLPSKYEFLCPFPLWRNNFIMR